MTNQIHQIQRQCRWYRYFIFILSHGALALFSFGTSRWGNTLPFAVSLGCDCSRRHRNSTHRCESHDSASTEQEGVTQEEEVQMIRFSLGMSTESWLELVFLVLFVRFYPAGGGGASCDSGGTAVISTSITVKSLQIWTKRCKCVKTLCVEFKKEIIIIKKKTSVSSFFKKT